MATYRFNWNPSAWLWMDLTDRLRELSESGSTTTSWSTGRSKQPAFGDRAILLRVGKDPKGLVGVGTIVREPYEAEHYDASRAAQGDTATFVDIRFSRLAAEPLLSEGDIKSLLPEDVHLFTQSPCQSVPDPVADDIINRL